MGYRFHIAYLDTVQPMSMTFPGVSTTGEAVRIAEWILRAWNTREVRVDEVNDRGAATPVWSSAERGTHR